MENLDVEGLFWLPSKPDDKVAGRLKFDATNGTELSLIGAFRNYLSPGTTNLDGLLGNDKLARVHGVAEGKSFTLCDSTQIQTTMNIPGIIREKYHSPVLLSGGHFNDDKQLTFKAANVRLRFLENWIGISGVQVRIETEGDKRIHFRGLTYNSPEESRASTSFGQIHLLHSGKLRDSRPVETTIEERCTLRLTFEKARSLDESVHLCSPIQDLVTIGLHAPSAMTELSLSLSDELKRASHSTSQWVNVYAQFTGTDTQAHLAPPHTAKMLFTFADVGGLAGVASWLEATRNYPSVLGILVNHWYVPQLYVDNRFFNAYTAAETLRRIQVGKQQINMKRGFNALAEKAGHTFVQLVGDLDSWITKVIQVRNTRVFHRGLHESSEGVMIYLLAESLYFLVVLCLLRECNVSEDALAKIQDHQRFSLLAKDLQT